MKNYQQHEVPSIVAIDTRNVWLWDYIYTRVIVYWLRNETAALILNISAILK